MIDIRLSTLAVELDAQLVGTDLIIDDVTSDSRKMHTNSLFVALKGLRFDGHSFAATAIENGAKALLVEHKLDVDIPQLIVKNSQKAMGAIGAYVRQQVNPYSIALTGSNGKTTVKEIVATILSQHHKVLFTAGNFNNEIGVPLTLLRLAQEHEFGVFELGANHQGEINYTSSLVTPQVALVNNVGRAHLEGFGSIEGVAQAKSEIFNHLSPDGTAIINADDDFADFMATKAAAFKQLSFSVSENVNADIKAVDIVADDSGCYQFSLVVLGQSYPVQLPLAGLHQVSNALAASAICIALNIPVADIVTGLSALTPVKGRMVPHKMGRILLVDDSYNANPTSVDAAISWLKQTRGFKCLVLGDLGELGDNSALLHFEVGEQAKLAGIDDLFCCGQLTESTSKAFGSEHFSDSDSLAQALKEKINQLPDQVTILVKGSRSAAMETVVEELLNANRRGEFV
ncbi:UDP-N-acetylmuramoylalanyl-D-glutamyl-2, 6-diaminopimelate--D-alanyl-D-alanine ligase [Shewanella sp. 10N.286.51.B7]|uniref:UDP-N-acetylmuramoyl-tripeptide--D-alanyl-D-alanine ligase n=1 Tax=Shewanella electrodiphila TaxID=934143 RepID=A0ABT0KUF7_9GAMM|nr:MULTISPECIES: UDP-N-acetylmuramoyl-tripeptide--D-alanyl-D-alanine ligase [Shewanella]MCL1047478.1 UDP-N-acetylmuramoyl-tripeptide--D-alanyl-D-alanine ligase [Shewanella electrodiphila]PMG79052.1 UDP-N-acetylmuramoylalanyl-D-glutamyl-2, 6-diaminopimelate--D-alanyl-D-alanine ligase [Shewanella sp. 10N.286.51.B7]